MPISDHSHTHTAQTTAELQVAIGSCGHSVTVPEGTLCRKLESGPWVVLEEHAVEAECESARQMAQAFGVPVAEDQLTNVQEVTRIY